MKKYDYTGIVEKAPMERDARIAGLKGAGRWFGMAVLVEAVVGAVIVGAAAALAVTTALVSLPAIVIGSVIAAIGLALSTWFGFYKNKKETLQSAKNNNEIVNLVDAQKATLKALDTEDALNDAYAALQKPENDFFKAVKAKGATPSTLIEKQLKPVVNTRIAELAEAKRVADAKLAEEAEAKRVADAKLAEEAEAKRVADAKLAEKAAEAKRVADAKLAEKAAEAKRVADAKLAETAAEAKCVADAHSLRIQLFKKTAEQAKLYREALLGLVPTETGDVASAEKSEEDEPASDVETAPKSKRTSSLVKAGLKGAGNLFRVRAKGSSKRTGAPITPAQELAAQRAASETGDSADEQKDVLALNATDKDRQRPENTLS